MKPSAAWFFGRIWSWRLGVHVRRSLRQPRDRRAPCRVRPLSRGPLEHLPTDFFRLYKPTYPKNIEYQDRSGVLPPQASVATKNLSGARSGTLPEGEPITGVHLHHPGAIHDEEGVVHPRGWGYVPVAMCLISLSLSCSLSCSFYGTILMYRELCYYSWILWCFSPSTLLWWMSFPLEVILSDWDFNDLRTLDVCLAVFICGDNGISRATWCMFW